MFNNSVLELRGSPLRPCLYDSHTRFGVTYERLVSRHEKEGLMVRQAQVGEAGDSVSFLSIAVDMVQCVETPRGTCHMLLKFPSG